MVEDKGDAELTALADAIGQEGLPDIENPDPVLTPEQKAAAEKEAAASKPPGEGDDKPPASKGTDGEGEGEGEGGEKAGDGELGDPLESLVKDEGFLKVLLEHPTLGPKLQHWADNAGDAQVASALERERPSIEAQAQRTAAEREEDKHFSEMSPEEIHEEIAKDDKQAAAYARFQQRKESAGQPDQEGIVKASKIYAYASRIQSVQRVLRDSGLSAEAKAELAPEKFTHLGSEEGVIAWGSAVFQALVTHESDKGLQGLFDEKWEAEKEERLVELDGNRPPTARGRGTAPTPDLMGTPSEELLEDALSPTPQKKGSKV